MPGVVFGVDLGRCNPRVWRDVARAADDLGYESVWVPEHLVFPATIDSAPTADGTHRAIDPRVPVFDAFAVLSWLAGVTERVRLGTNVFNIGLRHPFVTARAVATLDVLSNGRAEVGIGASWLAQEWEAVGLDFATRGARVDEAIALCRRLWTEPVIEHHGRFFDFEPVVFEPKPVQSTPRFHIGGDSPAALRRVVEHGDGWIGMIHDEVSFATAVEELRGLCAAHGRTIDELQRSALVAEPSVDAQSRWADAGATRLIVAPWQRSSDAVGGLERFARTWVVS